MKERLDPPRPRPHDAGYRRRASSPYESQPVSPEYQTVRDQQRDRLIDARFSGVMDRPPHNPPVGDGGRTTLRTRTDTCVPDPGSDLEAAQ
jgi:hypothetical protein